MTKIDTRGRKKTEEGRKKARGPLKSMRVSMGFREFVLDQLGGIPELRAKAMFGGVGLYSDDVFFGMMAADLLYFKVDDVEPARLRSGGIQAVRALRGSSGNDDDDALLQRAGRRARERPNHGRVGEEVDRGGEGGQERQDREAGKEEDYFNVVMR